MLRRFCTQAPRRCPLGVVSLRYEHSRRSLTIGSTAGDSYPARRVTAPDNSHLTSIAPPTSRGLLLRGFLAGMTSGDEDAFAETYDVLGLVDEALLDAFEDDLRTKNEPSLHIVFGSRLVSVFDHAATKTNDVISESSAKSAVTVVNNEQQKKCKDTEASKMSPVTRHLVFNQRPGLVQTAVVIDAVGASYQSDGTPSPLAYTHLGGLALSYLFWKQLLVPNREGDQRERPTDTASPPPNIVIIGAGGCSLAATLAKVTAASRTTTSVNQKPHHNVTAVEVCPEVIQAAEQWFGVAPHQRNFDLVEASGIQHLASSHDASIDILIIDAEDGVAPPLEMQTEQFWRTVVMPKLANFALVGINVIGSVSERNALRKRLEHFFNEQDDDITEAVVVHSFIPPPEAELEGDTHALFFFRVVTATSTKDNDRAVVSVFGGLDDDDALLYQLVSEPESWKRVLRDQRDSEQERE